MSTVTGVVAYVIRNVFSRVRNTDSEMSSWWVYKGMFLAGAPAENFP